MKKLATAAVFLSLIAVPAHALSIKDLLATIAMPLAVAAVSDVNGVQDNQLADLVATLNQANVPPAQFVEVIRYVPVALVNTNDQPVFVDYVQNQYAQGITGNALVNAIVQQLQSQYDITPQISYYEPPQTIVTQTVPVMPRQIIVQRQPVQVQQPYYLAPSTIFVDNNYIPQAVQTRAAEMRVHPVHPHGGPPGQLKKMYGVKTGAEIVHGAPPPQQRIVVQQQPVVVEREHGHGRGHQKNVVQSYPPPMISAAPQPQVIQHGPPGGIPPGQAKKNEGGDGEHGGGKGKGHGKKD